MGLRISSSFEAHRDTGAPFDIITGEALGASASLKPADGARNRTSSGWARNLRSCRRLVRYICNPAFRSLIKSSSTQADGTRDVGMVRFGGNGKELPRVSHKATNCDKIKVSGNLLHICVKRSVLQSTAVGPRTRCHLHVQP